MKISLLGVLLLRKLSVKGTMGHQGELDDLLLMGDSAFL